MSIVQWTQFCTASALQAAVATVLEQAAEPYNGRPTFYDDLADMYTAKRTKMLTALTAAGFNPFTPDGTALSLKACTADALSLAPAVLRSAVFLTRQSANTQLCACAGVCEYYDVVDVWTCMQVATL
jgi:hypothetical protein